jgi:hypothetical protein
MIRLVDAEFVCTRAFDVADGIALEACREVIARGGTAARRLSLQREGSEYLQVLDPPLGVELGERALQVRGAALPVRVSARLLHHGAISITVRVPVHPGTPLEELIPIADELYDSKALDALATEEMEKLRAMLRAHLDAPHSWETTEGYTTLFVRKLEGAASAAEVLAAPCLTRLLLGEVKEPRLSESEEREVLEHHFSYTPNDLVIVEWNAAFVYEPSGSEDVVDLLELANAQLLELRYYDAVLDAELARVYDAIGDRRTGSLLWSPYKRLLRELIQTVIELSEFIERVENSLKIVGDVYLARVYEATLKQLRIARWTEQVSRKHRLLLQTYTLLKGEVDTGRSLTLEAMIVILIVIEILMALLKVTGH